MIIYLFFRILPSNIESSSCHKTCAGTERQIKSADWLKMSEQMYRNLILFKIS